MFFRKYRHGQNRSPKSQNVNRRVPTLEKLEDRRLLATWAGEIPDGTVWSSAEVELITDDAFVLAESTLTIQPGTVVKFQTQWVDLRIDGTLNAEGTVGQNILFTEYRDDTGGDTNGDGGASAPEPGNWGNIEVKGDATIRNAQIRYGGRSSTEFYINGGTVTLEDSVISDSGSGGVSIRDSDPVLRNNTYENNVGAAIGIDLNSDPVFEGIVFTNNGINGVRVTGGTLERDLVWSDPEIVYWISSFVTIPNGLSLTVESGPTVDDVQIVKFEGFNTLYVDGTLTVNGTALAPVVFTSDVDDTAGGDTNNDGDATSPARGDWNRIEIRSASTGSTIRYADIRYGGGADADGQVEVYQGELTLENSVIHESSTDGVRIEQSDPVLQNNTYKDNTEAAVSMDKYSNPDIDGVLVMNNGINGLQLDSGALGEDLIWDDPDIVYLIDDVIVLNGKSLTIEAGQIIKSSNQSYLRVHGTLTVHGMLGDPVVFTSLADDIAGGDTNNDADATSPAGGDWSKIALRSGSTGSTINHADIRYASSAVSVESGELTLENSILQESAGAGARIQNSNPVFQNNTFKNNTVAAVSMDLKSNPDIDGVVAINNGINGVRLDFGATSTDLIWDDPDIVYWVYADITVPSLTVGAGQIIKFRSPTEDVLINGTLTVNGTAADPVIFTSASDDTAGGDTNNDADATSPARGDWSALVLWSTSSGNTIRHADIRYGGNQDSNYDRGQVAVDDCDLTIENSIIQESAKNGIFSQLNGAHVVLHSNLIINNDDAGIEAAGGTLIGKNNTIDGNERGVLSSGSGTSVDLANNLITFNSRSGVRISVGGTVDFSYNDVFNPTASMGNYEAIADQTGINNNRSVDPMYADRANLAFQLLAGSPAIDSATSVGAPATDFDGHARVDDPNTANTGGGVPDFYDRGAFEFQTSSVPSPDFDGDGDVDGDDFLIWQSSFNNDDGGDADGDGDTDGDDFLIWQANFGTSTGASAGSVVAAPWSSHGGSRASLGAAPIQRRADTDFGPLVDPAFSGVDATYLPTRLRTSETPSATARDDAFRDHSERQILPLALEDAKRMRHDLPEPMASQPGRSATPVRTDEIGRQHLHALDHVMGGWGERSTG